ncbi:MAG: cobalamin biosynthesis protein CbiX [Gammaproteobacteria bacterium]|nr:cobalamin biosynthesis protein CbiX [Gammaproteobacteria bacterium]
MNSPTLLLVDNGSTRPAATLSLRRIARNLSERIGQTVYPVSLQHADRVSADQLDGKGASTLTLFLREQLAEGQREFVVLPLFFGRSRALTSFIPEQAAELAQSFGDFRLIQADVLSPLPGGDPRLAEILADNVKKCTGQSAVPPDHVIVVDHGSPIPEVTAVREAAAATLKKRLPASVRLTEAVMERRSGASYDFNGQLLQQALAAAAAAGHRHVVLAMMFISPGSHAGPGGDIGTICAKAMAFHPGLEVCVSSLVGEHPMLIDILQDRLAAAIA